MESLDHIVKELKADPELEKRKTRDEKLLYICSNLCVNALEELYVINKLELTCSHLSVDPYADDSFKKYCDDGFKTATNCIGNSKEACGWYKTRYLVDELKNSLNDQELELYYHLWIHSIAKNYDKTRIVTHLEKHLKENRDDRWFASAQNLLNIYELAGDTKTPNKAFTETNEILGSYKGKLTTEQKLYRLLNHLRNHVGVATVNPFNHGLIVEMVKKINKEYQQSIS